MDIPGMPHVELLTEIRDQQSERLQNKLYIFTIAFRWSRSRGLLFEEVVYDGLAISRRAIGCAVCGAVYG